MPRTAPDATADAPWTRREQRYAAGRAQLLDAAEEVFGRKGFHDTTLKEVAERAGFSVGSVYSFFASKEDLFGQIFVRRGGELLAEMEAAVADDADPLDQLHRLVDVEVGFFRRHPSFGLLSLRYANVTRLAIQAPADRPAAADYDRATKVHAEVFARGQRTGRLRDGDPDALSRLFSGLVLSFQTLDPVVVQAGGASPVLSLDALHDLVTDAFGGAGARRQ
jgi:AcrR family transcriptional regulator